MWLIWAFLGDFIFSVFGNEYMSVKPIVTILLIMVTISFAIRSPLGNMLSAVGKAKWNSYASIVLLILNILLNLILIPKYGLFGAAYATLISISAGSLIYLVLSIAYIRKLDTGDK